MASTTISVLRHRIARERKVEFKENRLVLMRPNDCQILSSEKDVQDTEQTALRNSLSTQNLMNNPQQNLIPPTTASKQREAQHPR